MLDVKMIFDCFRQSGGPHHAVWYFLSNQG